MPAIRKYFTPGSFILLLLLGYRAYGQGQSWDTTYRPEIYPLLRDLYRSEKADTTDIVFLGNSITFWGLFNETLGVPGIKNRGIPGDITNGVLERLDDILEGRPVKIFILIGINDIARGIPDSIVIRNQQRILARIREQSPRTKIFLQTLLPTNSSFKKLSSHYNKEEHIRFVNKALRRLAAASGATLIDLYALFDDGTGQLIKELSFDGVHLTKKGYDRWIQLMKQHHYLDDIK
ncbi:GDSL-type esterase/lipase family protein [Niabella beijingensis]|uniref:GDSL-type esterase/lipase family protein n=1 Tax=Niabella beijingensis TaxID=2872700 RepID=UPI001CBC414A|nr:GDSL-type esterase/lipase family protein [Niabella beijingensis]MBZ4190868.1 sialate O-acetylesterase [Niabella beijingensis]